MAIAKKKKRFYTVNIPLIRKTTHLQALDLKELDNRYIKYDLTRSLKGKSTVITVKTSFNPEDETIETSAYELRVLPNYIKRMVRRGTNYVEDSFICDAKDGKIQIKPFLVTRRKVSRAVRKALRNKAKEEITSWAKENSREDIFAEALKGKIQKDFSLKLKKIYPLSMFELRVIKISNQ